MRALSPTRTSPPPPLERTKDPLSEESSHTDPGPPLDESPVQHGWRVPEARHEMINEAAYYKAEQRGFESGYEEMDWLEAELELFESTEQDEAEAIY